MGFLGVILIVGFLLWIFKNGATEGFAVFGVMSAIVIGFIILCVIGFAIGVTAGGY